MCRSVLWEKLGGGNIRGTKAGKGEKQVRAVVAGQWEVNRRLSRQ